MLNQRRAIYCVSEFTNNDNSGDILRRGQIVALGKEVVKFTLEQAKKAPEG
jgi:hypothetical protein